MSVQQQAAACLCAPFSDSDSRAQLLHELPALLSDLDASAASVLQIANAAQLPRTSASGIAAVPRQLTDSAGAGSKPKAPTEDSAAIAARGRG